MPSILAAGSHMMMETAPTNEANVHTNNNETLKFLEEKSFQKQYTTSCLTTIYIPSRHIRLPAPTKPHNQFNPTASIATILTISLQQRNPSCPIIHLVLRISTS